MTGNSTIEVRLRLEAEADRLQDAAADALERWRELQTQLAACELALCELPERMAIVAGPSRQDGRVHERHGGIDGRAA